MIIIWKIRYHDATVCKPQEISDIQAGKQDDAVNKLDWQAQKAEQARIRKIENSLKK